jgi:hypothetical protein
MLSRLKDLVPFLIPLLFFGCEVGHEVTGVYEPIEYSRDWIERQQLEVLKVEDVTIGSGPEVARGGKRLSGHIKATYENGTVVYEGPVVIFFGFQFKGEPSLRTDFDLNYIVEMESKIGVGIYGMAVGGRRRFVVPSPVCGRHLVDCTFLDPRSPTLHENASKTNHGNLRIPKGMPLLVDFTLKEACRPILKRQGSSIFGFDWVVCRP